MNTLFLGIVIFLIVLAVFDLVVGVSNDAVNFLNSAVGAKVARYRTVVTVAAIGVFAGAALSNGMMDVARHGIMTPAYFSFYDVMCVFLAVMVTDVVLLDVFNTLGMPTSPTVSMVFELLGGAFAIALIQEDFPVPASPKSRQLFAGRPATKASVLSRSFFLAPSYPTRSSNLT